MSEQPLVSIYVPTRNRPALLQRAVRSALAQDYSAIEVVVSVDGPDADSEQVLREFAGEQRLIVHVSETAGGACVARNTALALAHGELATGLDDDDELLPTHVSTLTRALSSSGAAFACTSTVLQRTDSSIVRHGWSGPVTLQTLLEQNVVGNQVLTRTEHLRAVEGYDAALPAWQDYDLWVRIAQRFGSGVRIDARTYLQNAHHAAPRISAADNIWRAHALFTSKHAALLEPRHRLSLELLAHATTHTPFPLSRLPAYVAAGYGARALAALLSDRVPALRSPLRRLRSRLHGDR